LKCSDEINAERRAIQHQIFEPKKNGFSNLLKESMRFFKEFGFTTWMMNGSLADVRKK
jgi:hypothetical protein